MANENTETNVNENVNTETAEQQGADTTNDSESVDTLQSLMAENARLKAESARNKTAIDKLTKNNGELTKQLRAKMTAQEQEEEAKREAAEAQQKEINELKEFKRRAEATERYLTMGMSADFAKQAADAEVKGDMDAFATVMKQYNEASIKAQKDEWLKSRPDINASHGDDDDMKKLEKEVEAAMGL